MGFCVKFTPQNHDRWFFIKEIKTNQISEKMQIGHCKLKMRGGGGKLPISRFPHFNTKNLIVSLQVYFYQVKKIRHLYSMVM
jgi:hypothetical protein